MEPRSWSFESLLAAGHTEPRLFPLGVDALELMNAHLLEVAERARDDEKQREAAELAASLALDWLASVVARGLVADCQEADIAAMEEEWACMETEFRESPSFVPPSGSSCEARSAV